MKKLSQIEKKTIFLYWEMYGGCVFGFVSIIIVQKKPLHS